MILRASLLALLLVSASACVSQGGFSVSKSRLVAKNFVKFGALPGSEADNGERVTRTIAIGYVYSLREYQRDDYANEYAWYLESYGLWKNNRAPGMSAKDFEASIVGSGRIVISDYYPITQYANVLVPSEMRDSFDFEYSLKVVLQGFPKDLVAATTNDDGVLTLTHFLCDRSAGLDSYQACKRNYTRGFFDAETGKEIDSKLRFKEDGATIDVVSLQTRLVR